MFVAEQFTGQAGIYTPMEETIASFKAVVDGEMDQYPEQAFYMVGGADDVKGLGQRLLLDEGFSLQWSVLGELDLHDVALEAEGPGFAVALLELAWQHPE